MKWVFFLLISLVISCSHFVERTPASNTLERHVVFDIDWTIVSEIKNPVGEIKKSPRLVSAQGSHYYLNEGVEDFLAEILSHKEMKISFFSGGKAIRNDELLSKLKLKDGRSLKEIAYKILSYEDLTKVPGVPDTAPFGQRFKKDLSKISPDLSELVMFDDMANFALDGARNQNDHVFFIGSAFNFFEKYEDVAPGPGIKYLPANYNEWLLDRKKIYVLHGAFRDAYEESLSGSITLLEALKKREILLRLDDHRWNKYSQDYYQKFFKNEIVKSLPEFMNCHNMAKAILGF